MQSTNLLYTLDQSPGEGAPCMHAMDLVPGGVVRDALQHPACPPENPLSTFRGNVNSGWHSPVLLVLICSLRSWRAPMVPQLSLSCPLLLVVLKLFSWLTALRRNCSKYRCTSGVFWVEGELSIHLCHHFNPPRTSLWFLFLTSF